MNNRLKLGGISWDIEKGFDYLNHDILLSKKECCGITGKEKSLYKHFPNNRCQRVSINNKFNRTILTNLYSDTTLLQPNRTNTPVHTETEQYTYIQLPAPEDECNNIRNMLSNKKLS